MKRKREFKKKENKSENKKKDINNNEQITTKINLEKITNKSEKEIIIDKLKIISEIKEHDKIFIYKDSINIDKRYLQSIRRWYNNDNRYISTYFLENTINLGVEMNIDKKLMKDTLNGLKNIKLTYKNDEIINSKLDSLIKKINEI